MHIHDLDFLAWILGMPKVVSAAGVAGRAGALDSVCTLMTGHPKGAVSFAEGSLEMAAGFPFTMGLKIALEAASIELNSRLTPGVLVACEGKVEYPEIPQPEVPAQVAAGSAGNISALGGYLVEVKYFVDCLEKGETPAVVSPEEAKSAVRLCNAAARSARSGKPIAL